MEGGKRLQEDMTDIQKAMLETSSDQTMEIKLNVLNDTVELQRIGSEAPVSDEAIGRGAGFRRAAGTCGRGARPGAGARL